MSHAASLGEGLWQKGSVTSSTTDVLTYFTGSLLQVLSETHKFCFQPRIQFQCRKKHLIHVKNRCVLKDCSFTNRWKEGKHWICLFLCTSFVFLKPLTSKRNVKRNRHFQSSKHKQNRTSLRRMMHIKTINKIKAKLKNNSINNKNGLKTLRSRREKKEGKIRDPMPFQLYT